MEFVYIIRFGEIWIKGKNRRFFEQALEQNIRRTLKRGGCNAVLESERGRLYAVESGEVPGKHWNCYPGFRELSRFLWA